MNSRVPYDKRPSRDTYGTNIDHQNKILDRMTGVAKSLNAVGSQSTYQFHEGHIFSSQSLPQLYEMVREKLRVLYFDKGSDKMD